MENQIFDIVKEALSELNEELQYEEFDQITKDTSVFSGPGSIDSLTLVRLVSMLEEEVSELTGEKITLANDKVMSANNTPFKTVDTIVNFISGQMKGKTNAV